MSLPDDAKDVMSKWLKPPIVAENEQLKARVLELEAVLAKMEEAAVRNGVALQREAREAERKACLEIARTSSNKAEIISAIRARPAP